MNVFDKILASVLFLPMMLLRCVFDGCEAVYKAFRDEVRGFVRILKG